MVVHVVRWCGEPVNTATLYELWCDDVEKDNFKEKMAILREKDNIKVILDIKKLWKK